MRKAEKKIKIFNVILAGMWIGVIISLPAQAVTVSWKASNADIALGLPYNSLEFENPLTGNERVNGYYVMEWRDADYSPGWYDDWSVSDPAMTDGNANEIRMRNGDISIWTTTTVASDVISIHLVGDSSGGVVHILVDGTSVVQLDMHTAGLPQTALIIVKNLAYSTHTITVNDIFALRPGNYEGLVVATLGAAALSPNWGVKWWPSFWFLNARMRLYPTYGYVTVPTGFWWGWYWWYGYRPWQGPLGWYEPYCRYWYRPYWDYWPYYSYYRPWWHYWRWRGGPWFWGFRDQLTYRYIYWQPRIIYWWNWYWDPEGQGGCIEMVTQADEMNPEGSRILPFPDPEIPGFEYAGHQFTVNNDSNDISFSALDFVPIHYLESYVSGILPPEQVATFMESDIVEQLMTAGTGYVGIQHATWTHPKPSIIAATTDFTLYEGDTEGNAERTYEVSLPDPPFTGSMEVVNIVSSDPERLVIDGVDSDGIKRLYFYDYDYDIPQPVYVYVTDDTSSQGEEKVILGHFLESDIYSGFSLDVTIMDNECGGAGFKNADLNADCSVDLLDFCIFAENWLDP